MTTEAAQGKTKPSDRREGWIWWQRFEDFEVRRFVVSFVVLLALLLAVYFFGAADKEDAFDFACFASACFAGIVGGVALFFGNEDHISPRNVNLPIDGDRPELQEPLTASTTIRTGPNQSKIRERICYGLSLLMLFVALLNYALSHDTCQKLSVMIQASMIVVVIVSILFPRLILDKSKKSIGIAVNACLAVVIIAFLCVTIGFPWNFSKAFNTTTWLCTDQTKHPQ